MLSYRHLFHAGNHADVFKHVLLMQVAQLLARKDKPFAYLESHAGSGRYDLRHAWARKNREYENGVARIRQRTDAPAALAGYLQAVRAQNPDGELRWYPGSPWLVRQLLRPDDRMLLAELNADDCAALRTVFKGDRQVRVEQVDGYQLLKASLPPPERRALILIDSSFDRAREFTRLVDSLREMQRRFATGVTMIWYPLMEPSAMRRFERDIAALGLSHIAKAQLSVHDEHIPGSLRGSGMLIVNPPYGLDTAVPPALDWLWQALSPDGGGAWEFRAG